MKKIFSLTFLLLVVTLTAQENTNTACTRSKNSCISGYSKKFKNMLPTISEKRQDQIAKFLLACGLGSYYGFIVNHQLKSGNSFIKSLIIGVCEGTIRFGAFGVIIVIGVIAQEMRQTKGNFIISMDLGNLLFP